VYTRLYFSAGLITRASHYIFGSSGILAWRDKEGYGIYLANLDEDNEKAN
jgi:hypothetical protein